MPRGGKPGNKGGGAPLGNKGNTSASGNQGNAGNKGGSGNQGNTGNKGASGKKGNKGGAAPSGNSNSASAKTKINKLFVEGFELDRRGDKTEALDQYREVIKLDRIMLMLITALPCC